MVKKSEFSKYLDDPLMSPSWLFQKFSNIIKYESRFVINEPYISFINSVVKMVIEQFSSILSKDTIIFRARINKTNFNEKKHEEMPFPPTEMGPPPNHYSVSGRANPEGIPYLYCSGEMETAGAELRPWKGAYITIAEVKIKKNMKIVDLTLDINTGYTVWDLFFYDFTDIFSIQWPPELKLNYLVTQFFAELFKSVGFRGIKYNSDFNNGGNNFVLFFKEDYGIDQTYSIETTEVDFFFFKKDK